MKRVISLCCVAVILVSSMAAPVRAEEFDNDVFINVLDYNSDLFASQTITSDNNKILFDLPYYTSFAYIDCIFGTSNNNFSSVSLVSNAGSYSLTLVSLGNGIYRAYGNVVASASTFGLQFDTNGLIYVNILKCEVTRNKYTHFDIQAYCDIESYNYQNTIHYVPTDDVNYRIFTGVSTPTDGWLTLYIYSNDWKKYDYLDFQFSITCANIVSVSAIMGSTNVPLDVSTISNSTWVSNDYFVSMRMDLSGLDRTSSDFPMIILEARVVPDGSNVVSFANCSGILILDDYDPYYIFFNRFVSGFNSIVTAINNSFNTWFSNLHTWLDTSFSSLNNWISNQSEAIRSYVIDQNNVISNLFYLWFGQLYSWIDSQTSILESAIRGDTAPGDSFQDEVDQKDQELDEMAAVMDSVTKPPVDQINVSVDSIVSPADVQLLATPMAVFFDGQIFSQMIIMSILLATVSFVLFGKR